MTQPDVPPAIDSPMVSDLVSAMVSRVPERDVYVLENDSALYLTPRLRSEFPDATVVHLAAAARLITDEDPILAGGSRSATRTPEDLVDRNLLRKFLRYYCDGVIAVSPFVAERIRPHTSRKTPVRVASPYVQQAAYEQLRVVEPDLTSTIAVTVGQWREHKGIDQLVEAWPAVRKRHPDAELRIIGPGHPARYAETPGVTVCGFVDDLRAELSNASLYVHPARVEPFGVSVVEAMCAGLPALVTETTGAGVAVREVDDSLLTATASAALAAAVCRYFDTDLDRRVALSRRSREASESFTERVRVPRFRRQFRSLLTSVRSERFARWPGEEGR